MLIRPTSRYTICTRIRFKTIIINRSSIEIFPKDIAEVFRTALKVIDDLS